MTSRVAPRPRFARAGSAPTREHWAARRPAGAASPRAGLSPGSPLESPARWRPRADAPVPAAVAAVPPAELTSRARAALRVVAVVRLELSRPEREAVVVE